jgi:hypothetical protein
MRSAFDAIALLLYYALFPLVILPYLALMTGIIAFVALGFSIETMVINWAFWATTGLLYLFLCWAFYIWPRGDPFVLHEKGFRIRLLWRRLQTSMEAISAVFVGRALSRAEKSLRNVLGVLKPGQANWMSQLDGTALTVVLRDGTVRVFGALLTRFKREDLELLFLELVRRYPRFGANESPDHVTDSEAKPETIPVPKGASYKYVGVLLGVFIFAAIFLYSASQLKPGPHTLEEHFVVSAGTPRIVTLKVSDGEWIDLSLSVKNGKPVDLRVGRSATSDTNMITIKSAGLFDAEQVRSFHKKDTWRYTTPAIIIVTSSDRSDVVLKVEVSRAPSAEWSLRKRAFGR